MPKVMIAGGGSGGHIAPAIAVAEALTTSGVDVQLAHSNRNIDKVMVEGSPFNGMELPATPHEIQPFGFARFCIGYFNTTRLVRKVIQEQQVGCVLATGGFVSAPALQAARSEGCPTVLLNLDDPPGKANRLAVRWADHIASTVACGLKNAVHVAPPLRQCVIASSDTQQCKKQLGLDPEKMTLLVTGASQGATTINELLPALALQNPSAFQDWQVLHITGKMHISQMQLAWSKSNVDCVVIDFLHEMGNAWGAADLAITRGGANTIAEIAINAVPTIVLPYPYHKDEHQRTNAQPLEITGGVVVVTDHKLVDKNIQDVGRTILRLLESHQTRKSMKQAMMKHPPTNGATIIAETCIACIEAQ